jgi:hypothetical protein
MPGSVEVSGMKRNSLKTWWICGCLGGLAIVALLVWLNPLRMARANQLLESGAIDEARKHYQRLAAANPDSPGILHNLGLCDERRGAVEGAANSLRQAAKLLERSESIRYNRAIAPNVYYNLGNALFRAAEKSPAPLNLYREALANFKKAILAAPNDTAAKYNYELTRLRVQEAEQQKPNQSQSQPPDPKRQDSQGRKSNQPSSPQNDASPKGQSGNEANPQGRPGEHRTGGGSTSPARPMTKAEAEALLKMSENGALYQGPIMRDNGPTDKDW